MGSSGFNGAFAANEEDLANLFRAIDALKALPWFGPSVKDLRAFRMEQGSDFTAIVKGS
jgi:virulence-associated protein VapD